MALIQQQAELYVLYHIADLLKEGNTLTIDKNEIIQLWDDIVTC